MTEKIVRRSGMRFVADAGFPAPQLKLVGRRVQVIRSGKVVGHLTKRGYRPTK